MKQQSESVISQLFEVMAEEAFMGLLCFEDPSERCIYSNNLGRELLEIPADSDLGELKLDGLSVNEERGNFTVFTRDLLRHEGLYQDVIIQKYNGFSFVANLGVKRVSIQNQNFLLLMFQDVTLQKKLQRDVTVKQIEIQAALGELTLQNKKLKALDSAKDRFIALTTHELRTPLSAMVASAEVLQLKLYDNDVQLKEFIDIIYSQGLHLQELVNDILDFAKIQAGRMDLYVEQKNPKKLLSSLTESFISMGENSDIEISYCDNEEVPDCYYDELRLKQVLSNIFTNAIKYNVKGGSVKIWTEVLDNNLEIHIKDTGTGIAFEDLEKVFDEFETLGKVALHHKGTGLGMPISKRIMEEMGGSIHLDSELSKGTTFWILIPMEKTLDEELYRTRPDLDGDLVA